MREQAVRNHGMRAMPPAAERRAFQEPVARTTWRPPLAAVTPIARMQEPEMQGREGTRVRLLTRAPRMAAIVASRRGNHRERRRRAVRPSGYWQRCTLVAVDQSGRDLPHPARVRWLPRIRPR